MGQTVVQDGSNRAGGSVLTRHVCPFCGAIRENPIEPCFRCTMHDTSEARQTTGARLGPWYVLEKRNPSAPGMDFATLTELVHSGQVTGDSIVRGPTTNQLWCFAAKVKGVSRLLGVCYACGEAIEPGANQCPHCQKLQEPPMDPDVLLETRPIRPPVVPAPVMEVTPAIPLRPMRARDLARAFELPGPSPRRRWQFWKRK